MDGLGIQWTLPESNPCERTISKARKTLGVWCKEVPRSWGLLGPSLVLVHLLFSALGERRLVFTAPSSLCPAACALGRRRHGARGTGSGAGADSLDTARVFGHLPMLGIFAVQSAHACM